MSTEQWDEIIRKFALKQTDSFGFDDLAAGGVVASPTSAAPDRYVYYPGTEELGADEIRVIACGTGMPSARRSQAATCFGSNWEMAINCCSILVPVRMPISRP